MVATFQFGRSLLAIGMCGALTSAVAAGSKEKILSSSDVQDPLSAGAVARLGTNRFRPAGYVDALAFSPDGKTLASAGGHICLWDFATGKKLAQFTGDLVSTLFAFGHDGKTLIRVSDSGILRICDVANGKIVDEIALVNDPMHWDDYGAITPDGRFLAFKSNEPNTICVWDLTIRKEVKRIKSANYDSGPIAISLDGKALALGRGDIEIWDLAAGKIKQTLKPKEPSYLQRFGFSPDGTSLASSGSHGHGTRLWDLATGNVKAKYGVKPPETSAFAFSPDGKRIATITYDDEIARGAMLRIWDVAADREVWRLPTALPWSITALIFSPDGKKLVGAGTEGVIRVWDTECGTEIRNAPGSNGAADRLVASPDGRWITMGNQSDGILLWSVRSRTPIAHFTGASWYRVSAFSPDSKHLVYAHSDGTVRLCDVTTGKQIRAFDRHEKYLGASDQRDKDVTALVFDPDGKSILIAHADLTLRVQRVADGKVLRDHALEPSVHVGYHMHYHHFSQNAQVLIAQENFRVYDASRGRTLSTAETPSTELGSSVAVSPDGRSFAVVGNDGTLLIFETATGRKRLIIPREKTEENRYGFWGPLAFSPDGRLLALRSVDRNFIELRDTANGKRIHRIDNVQGGFTELTFVGDNFLATGGSDTTVLLWDLLTARKKFPNWK